MEPRYPGQFPQVRMRRNRKTPWSRRLVCEHALTPDDLIWPVFVQEGSEAAMPVPSMPGVCRLTIDRLVKAAHEAVRWGIPALAVFPVTPQQKKSPKGDEATHPDNLVCRALKAVKKAVGDQIGLIADVALDPYTDHGHDGVLVGEQVANDETLEILCRQAVVQASAGADVIAPSDMMDGRVRAIRTTLDEHDLPRIPIVSYAAKYASAYYGPFRDAAYSAPAFGDRRAYQMDPPNAAEALTEVALDLDEGADIVMVKPAGPYLDVIRDVKNTFGVPTAAYQVSGEYSLIKAAAGNGWIDERRVALESLTGIKRAGADIILNYFARDAARWLQEG